MTHLRAWEVNGDGTVAGLAFTARDLDQHDPLKGQYATGAVIDDGDANTFALYGGLVGHDLFNADIAYGIEMWVPMTSHQLPTCEPAPTQWFYFVMPLLRLVDDFTVDADGYYTYREDNHSGTPYPALTFTMHARHQWGRGPHPVRLVEVGAELEPAYLDPIPEHCNRAHVSTTMAPATAFQYTDNITHRKPARKGISWPA